MSHTLNEDYRDWTTDEYVLKMYARGNAISNDETVYTFAYAEKMRTSDFKRRTYSVPTGQTVTPFDGGTAKDYLIILCDNTITATMGTHIITFDGILACSINEDSLVISNNSGTTATIEVFVAEERL